MFLWVRPRGIVVSGAIALLAACVPEPERPDRDAAFHDFDGDGFTEDEGDCDDGDATVSPDGIESCNDRDDDCDETIDEDATDAPTWYTDADGDGFGASSTATLACVMPTGGTWVQVSGDCDDTPGTGATRHPGITWYADDDGDGFGDPTTFVDCAPDRATDVTVGTDCDDTDPTEKPGVTWYADGDGDSFGDPTSAHECDRAAPTDVLDATDCDDTDPTEKPGVNWYADADGDDYGNAASFKACSRAAPTDVLDATDCDDTPGAGATFNPATPWYLDADGDTFGGASGTPTAACEAPSGAHTLDHTDCDDAVGTGADTWPGNPNATVGDGDDDDCDPSLRDECWPDADGDGYGVATTRQQDIGTAGCQAADHQSGVGTDCDDDASTGALRNPGLTDVCNGIDDDCSGDEGNATDAGTWYNDADDDGWGTGSSYKACVEPDKAANQPGDCNDGDALVNPGRTEICRNGKDDDCDGPADCELRGVFENVNWAARPAFVHTALTATTPEWPPPNLGAAIVAIGDLDGDGKDEFLVSATGVYSGDGAVFWIEDPPAGGHEIKWYQAPQVWWRQFTYGGTGRVGLGSRVDAGDFDGDGALDGVFEAGFGGLPYASNGAVLQPDLTTTNVGQLFVREHPYGANSLQSRGFLGDQDGDLDEELVFWEYGSEGSPDSLWIVSGGETTEDRVLIATIDGPDAYHTFGQQVGRVDADGDGKLDLVVGAPNLTVAAADDGAVLVFRSPIVGNVEAADADRVLFGAEAAGLTTVANGPGRDVDGDGHAEFLAMQDWYASPGRVWVVAGPVLCPLDDPGCSVPNSSPLEDVALATFEAGENPISVLAEFAGDVNCDGEQDLLIADLYALTAYLFYGPLQGTRSFADADASFVGPTNGLHVAGLGDLNDDGCDDFGLLSSEYGGTLMIVRGNGI